MTLNYRSIRVAAFSAALLMNIASATAYDETKYPDLMGQWTAVGGSVNYVPGKPRGLGQEAPLTPEYQAIFQANLDDMAEGGQGTVRVVRNGKLQSIPVKYGMDNGVETEILSGLDPKDQVVLSINVPVPDGTSVAATNIDHTRP